MTRTTPVLVSLLVTWASVTSTIAGQTEAEAEAEAAAVFSEYCVNVYWYFGDCITYIEGLADEPGGECCAGVLHLKQLTQRDRSGPSRICQCVEDFARVLHFTYDVFRIQALPVQCNTTLSFPISLSMDCSES